MSTSLISINLVRSASTVKSTTARALSARFSSHMAANGEVMEKEKQKSLKGETNESISDHPGWNENLASHAEASVKADHASEKSVERLQQESVEHIKKQHH
ncbi:hypothetical protein K7432_000131 [Basidiobolus ranarum]|uniref:Late embryogenesis abundant protein n=1 Tax=Basidiobolus ranarum TaxID=34480 RepID=A0ABR2X541_9FUNG